MKIIVNQSYGIFKFSSKTVKLLEERGYDDHYIETWRTDPILISVIEELGDAVSARYSKIKIIEIPDDVDWEIRDYDGIEIIVEKHRSWS